MEEKELNEKIKQRVMKENMTLATSLVFMLFGVVLTGVIAVIFQSKIALTIAIVLLIISICVNLMINRSIERIKNEITEDPSNEK